MMKQFFALTLAGAALFAPSAFSQQSGSLSSDSYQELFRADRAARGVDGGASCAGCHAGMAKGQDGHLHLEYPMWQGKRFEGAHYNSFNILNGPQSELIAKALVQSDEEFVEAFKRADCLQCHGLGHATPKKLRSKMWHEREPVSCEACHGHAGTGSGDADGWLGRHTLRDWASKDRREWRKYGMYDTRDVLLWAENCLECHHGTATVGFSHHLLGAGHPDISFELLGDLSGVPVHWRWERSYLKDVPNEGVWQCARIWAVGQAITLRETMRALLRWSERPSEPRPDLALFSCFSCHRPFYRNEANSTPPSRSPERLPHVSGEPAWNGVSWAVCKQLAYELMPESQAKFDAKILQLFNAMSLRPDRKAVRAAAGELATLADELARKANTTLMDFDKTRNLLIGIAEDYEFIGAIGPYGADQAIRAFEVLYLDVWNQSAQKLPENTHTAVEDSLNTLRKAVYDKENVRKPSLSRFDYKKFEAPMKDLARLWKASDPGS
ncbi:MAG: hypothetical protein IH986_03180 [Planctomycetes bacterium]|nr:hypothetical protein [Planctomycetota bacterium]